MRFKVGVIGARGYIARDYRQEVRNASDEARIVALCARRAERLREATQQDGAELATGDWREVVEHPDVNLVVVATPDALHHDAVMACARLPRLDSPASARAGVRVRSCPRSLRSQNHVPG